MGTGNKRGSPCSLPRCYLLGHSRPSPVSARNACPLIAPTGHTSRLSSPKPKQRQPTSNPAHKILNPSPTAACRSVALQRASTNLVKKRLCLVLSAAASRSGPEDVVSFVHQVCSFQHPAFSLLPVSAPPAQRSRCCDWLSCVPPLRFGPPLTELLLSVPLLVSWVVTGQEGRPTATICWLLLCASLCPT